MLERDRAHTGVSVPPLCRVLLFLRLLLIVFFQDAKTRACQDRISSFFTTGTTVMS